MSLDKARKGNEWQAEVISGEFIVMYLELLELRRRISGISKNKGKLILKLILQLKEIVHLLDSMLICAYWSGRRETIKGMLFPSFSLPDFKI